MNRRDAERLSRRIVKEDPQCRVTGIQHYGVHGGWALTVLDTRTGYPFTVNDADDWQERQAGREADRLVAEEWNR